MMAAAFTSNRHAKLARHCLKLLDAPIQRVAVHGVEQFGSGVHVRYSIANNIIYQWNESNADCGLRNVERAAVFLFRTPQSEFRNQMRRVKW